MLVLTLKRGTGAKIGNTIEVTVLEVNKNGEVRVGIKAPDRLRIHRTDGHHGH